MKRKRRENNARVYTFRLDLKHARSATKKKKKNESLNHHVLAVNETLHDVVSHLNQGYEEKEDLNEIMVTRK